MILVIYPVYYTHTSMFWKIQFSLNCCKLPQLVNSLLHLTKNVPCYVHVNINMGVLCSFKSVVSEQWPCNCLTVEGKRVKTGIDK